MFARFEEYLLELDVELKSVQIIDATFVTVSNAIRVKKTGLLKKVLSRLNLKKSAELPAIIISI